MGVRDKGMKSRIWWMCEDYCILVMINAHMWMKEGCVICLWGKQTMLEANGEGNVYAKLPTFLPTHTYIHIHIHMNICLYKYICM